MITQRGAVLGPPLSPRDGDPADGAAPRRVRPQCSIMARPAERRPDLDRDGYSLLRSTLLLFLGSSPHVVTNPSILTFRTFFPKLAEKFSPDCPSYLDKSHRSPLEAVEGCWRKTAGKFAGKGVPLRMSEGPVPREHRVFFFRPQHRERIEMEETIDP